MKILVETVAIQMDFLRSDITSLKLEQTMLLNNWVALGVREQEEQGQCSALPSEMRDNLGGGDGKGSSNPRGKSEP